MFRPRIAKSQPIVAMLAVGVIAGAAQAAYIEPLLRYSYDYGTGSDAVVDSGLSSGSSVAASGTFVNDATRTSATPYGFSTAAQDNGTGTTDYLSGGDAAKLDGLGSITVTAWVYYENTPSDNDRIVSKLGNVSGSLTGWDFLLQGGATRLSFSEIDSQGYISAQSPTTISTAPGWQFVAVSYNATTEVASFFRGTEALAVASLGSNSNSGFNAGGNTAADVRVGSTAGSSSDRSPDALFDDVRVYNGALSMSQIEAIRLEAQTLVYQTSFDGAINTQPAGWEILVGNVGDGSTSGWKLNGAGNYVFTQGATNGASHYTGTLENGGDPTDLANVLLETSFTRSGTNVAGLIARVQDDDTFYHVRLIGNSSFQMYRFDNGSASLIGSATASDSYTSGEAWSIRWKLLGEQLTAWLYNEVGDEVAMIDVTDATYASGSVGVRAQSNAEFLNFRVQLVPTPAALSAGLVLLVGAAASRRRRRSTC